MQANVAASATSHRRHVATNAASGVGRAVRLLGVDLDSPYTLVVRAAAAAVLTESARTETGTAAPSGATPIQPGPCVAARITATAIAPPVKLVCWVWVGGGAVRRADVDLFAVSGDVHRSDQLLDGEGTVAIAVADAGLRVGTRHGRRAPDFDYPRRAKRPRLGRMTAVVIAAARNGVTLISYQ